MIVARSSINIPINKFRKREHSTWILLALLLLSMYIALYIHIYDIYLSVVFGYLGFLNDSENATQLVFSIASIFSALLFLPRKLAEGSDFFSWMVFVLVFTPAQVAVAKMGLLEEGSYPLSATLLISMIFISVIPRVFKIRSIRIDLMRKIVSPKILLSTTLIIIVILVAKFISIMSLSGIEEIYDQRSLATKFGIGRGFGYLINWSSGFFAPVLLAYALISRDKLYLFGSIAALLTVYMITAAKMVIAIFGVILIIHFLLKYKLLERPFLLILLPIIALSFAGILFTISGVYLTGSIFYFVSQAVMRGIGIQSIVLPHYVEFFSNNPNTLYSHVSGISGIVDYPYERPLGFVIGTYMSGNPKFNANSSFWATDGIAALGYAGIVYIGIIMGLMFSILNALSRGVNMHFMCLAMVPFVMAASNTSIFTSLLTSGGALVFLVARYAFPETRAGRYFDR